MLNARFESEDSLIDAVIGSATLAEVIKDFQQKKVDSHPKLAESSKDHKRRRLARIKKDRGETAISAISTKWCADYLKSFSGDSYKQHRSVLMQVMDHAATMGEWDGVNPVKATDSSDITDVKDRQRLTLGQFRKIHAMAEPWFQIALELAITTLQGRAEVSTMQYADVKDGVLYIIRKKTHKKSKTAYIAASINEELEAILARSRQLPPLSPYIVHRPQERRLTGDKGHYSQVRPDYISRMFAKLRDKLPELAALPREQRPTFHEIRSLGAHLMEQSGVPDVEIQALLGHAELKTTDIYLDGHTTRWSIAKVSGVKWDN